LRQKKERGHRKYTRQPKKADTPARNKAAEGGKVKKQGKAQSMVQKFSWAKKRGVSNKGRGGREE